MDTELFLHVDVDAFFASVEQVLNPDLKGRPVAVGGGVRGRGVVGSASYEATACGVRPGVPIYRARELCPEAKFLPPRHEEYNRFSEQVFDVLSEVSPSVEQTSLGEAHVDLSGCERLYGAWSARPVGRLPFRREAEGVYRRSGRKAVPLKRRRMLPEGLRWAGAVAVRVKRAVRARTGLSVSVGLAANRLAAKTASDYGKPDGLTVLCPGAEADFMGLLELPDVPGIGRATLQKLHKWNVRTVEAARELPGNLLADTFGPERGRRLYELFRGRGTGEPVAPDRPRSISRETTFWTASSDLEFVESMLFYLTERLGRALRRERMGGRTVQMKIRYHDFTTVQRSRSMSRCTDRDEEIFALARKLLRAGWLRSKRVRLVGVGLTDLRPARAFQQRLFDNEAERCRRLDRCLDSVRERFGFDAVQRGLSINLTAAGDEEHPGAVEIAAGRP